jgi:Tfp pilus assembly protein PilV
MRSQVAQPAVPPRRGITLMEVLISIGILAIGLTSVVAILPAGRKQATKAIIYDRASLAAANALADAVTSGICKENSLDSVDTAVSVDPLGAWSVASPPTNGMWRQTGVFANTGDAVVASAAAVTRQVAQARDDLEVTPATNDDDPPLYLAIDGARAFTGRFSCALLRTSLDGNPLTAGDMARLAVVVFYNRETAAADAFVSATLASGQLEVTPPSGKTLADILRPGSVFYHPAGSAEGEKLHQITSVAVSSPTTAFVTHTGTDFAGSIPITPAPPPNIAILLDSVGLAERIVTIEGTEEFSR